MRGYLAELGTELVDIGAESVEGDHNFPENLVMPADEYALCTARLFFDGWWVLQDPRVDNHERKSKDRKLQASRKDTASLCCTTETHRQKEKHKAQKIHPKTPNHDSCVF